MIENIPEYERLVPKIESMLGQCITNATLSNIQYIILEHIRECGYYTTDFEVSVQLGDHGHVDLYVHRVPSDIEIITYDLMPDKAEHDADHNFSMYYDAIITFEPFLCNDDVRYLANQSAKLYKKISKFDSCIDNYRVTKVDVNGNTNKRYRDSVGCCGCHEEEVFNSRTGNRFYISFNYGH